MNEHKKFEILCALVVVGQASDADLCELKRHLEACVDCQNRISGFAQISAQVLPLAGERHCKRRSPASMTARFVERARAEGVPLRDSTQLLPSHLSFRPLSWKRSVAVALLLIAMIAGGISRAVHSRARSADTTTVAKLELPSEKPSQIHVTQNRSTQQPTKLLPVPRKTTMSKARFAGLKQDGSSGPEPFLHDIHSHNRSPREAAFDRQVSSANAESQYPRLVQAYDRSSSRPWLVAPSLMPFTGRNSLTSTVAYLGPYPKEPTAAFATASLNFPLRVFSFGPDRTQLSDSPLTHSESTPNIDWYQVWLLRTKSLPNSNYPPQSYPRVLAPAWPFSQDSTWDQQ